MNFLNFESVGIKIRPITSEYRRIRIIKKQPRLKFKSIATNTEDLDFLLNTLRSPEKKTHRIVHEEKNKSLEIHRKISKNLTPRVRLRFYLPDPLPNTNKPKRSICHLLSFV